MLNKCIFMGELVNDIEFNKDDSKKEYAKIRLSILSDIELDDVKNDYVDIIAYTDTSNCAYKSLEKGNVIAVKAHIVRKTIEDDMKIIAEKVSYLAQSIDNN